MVKSSDYIFSVLSSVTFSKNIKTHYSRNNSQNYLLRQIIKFSPPYKYSADDRTCNFYLIFIVVRPYSCIPDTTYPKAGHSLVLLSDSSILSTYSPVLIHI